MLSLHEIIADSLLKSFVFKGFGVFNIIFYRDNIRTERVSGARKSLHETSVKYFIKEGVGVGISGPYAFDWCNSIGGFANNVKKMFVSSKELISHKEIVEFTLPRLHKGKCWYVDFYAFDPSCGKLRRKKYMLDRYTSCKEREKAASVLIHNIFEKLKAGWNPFVNARRTRQYTEFSVVVNRYESYIRIAGNKGTLKAKTVVDYLSRLNQFRAYMSETGANIRYVYQFDRAFIIDFLDYLIFDKDVNARTRNNYRSWLSTFCTWLKDRLYIENNPSESIQSMREEEKFRNPLPPDALAKLRDYTKKNNPPFYLACMMEYYTFIRPEELRHIKIGDISIENQTVYVSPDVSKNRKGQFVALNDSLLNEMISQGVFNHASDDYLFGWNLVPGERQVYVNRFRMEWRKLRKALDFPDSYQFYSLKDSGIRDLANAEGIVVARDQARHCDISITNHYLKSDHSAHEETKHYKGSL